MSDAFFRPATEADLPALAAIYIDAVDTIGPAAYTPGQIAAWRRWPSDEPAEFRQRLTAGVCRVAEVAGAPVAFAEFTPPDHLDFLYTSGQFSRRGLASQLHEQLEEIARKDGAVMLRTEASYLSRPVFKRLGYEVVEIEDVERFGEMFRRFKMRKILRPEPPATTAPIPCLKSHQRSFASAPIVAAEEELIFTAHDVKNPGWFKGRSKAGLEGYFPAAWFAVDENRGVAIANRDYDAGELNVVKNEAVSVIEIESGWARAMNAQADIGWIPHRCVSP